MPSAVIRLSWGSLLTSPAVMTMAWVRVPRREVLLTGLRLLLGIVPTVIMRQHIPLRVLELEHGDDDAAARVTSRISVAAAACGLLSICLLTTASDAVGRRGALCAVQLGWVLDGAARRPDARVRAARARKDGRSRRRVLRARAELAPPLAGPRRRVAARQPLVAAGAEQGRKRVRNSQLQRLLSRPFSIRFG